MKTTTAWVRRAAQALWALGIASFLAACGGGGSGSAGTPVLGGGGSTAATVADLTLQLDKTSVTNNGTDLVKLTVTSVDANRTVVGDVPIKFSVDSAGVLTPSATNTDKTTGVLTATVGIGSDQTNRKITITATAGSVSRTVSFNVVDSVSGSQVADLAVVLDRTTLPNDGSQTVKVTVTTLDANRAAVGGAPVSFRLTDSGDAYISANGASSSDANSGQIVATLGLNQNKTNRSISVTAVSGTVQRTVSFNVVDPVVSIPKASDLTLTLDKATIGNAGQDLVTATVTAVDAKRNVIAGIPVSFTVNNNATIATSGSATDATGVVTGAIRIGADKSNRLVTVTVTSDTITRSATFQVIGAKIQATAVPQQPPASSTGNTVSYRVVDVNTAAMAGVDITVSAPGLADVTGKTDVNGAYTYTYTAPATAGDFAITARAAGFVSTTTVTVPSANSSVPTATPLVSTASLAASPNVVAVNAVGSSTNQAQLRALFQSAANAPVKNVRVRFDTYGDQNSIGGTIASGSALVYSDAQGVAVTNYSPAQRSSPTNGLTVRACWDYNDFAAGTCPNSVLTTLTVVSDPLSITIGTDNTISEGASKLTYVKRYVLLVVDSAGNPKSDVQIAPSVDLLSYGKGQYLYDKGNAVWVLDSDGQAPFDGLRAATCLNEDVNRNGLIDIGEDTNGNGQLDPRKSDVSISMVGTTKTDASGSAILQIEYPKSVGSWVYIRIAAAAAGVLSPPAYYTTWLPVLASELKLESPPPSFVVSPYGLSSSCSNPN